MGACTGAGAVDSLLGWDSTGAVVTVTVGLLLGVAVACLLGAVEEAALGLTLMVPRLFKFSSGSSRLAKSGCGGAIAL